MPRSTRRRFLLTAPAAGLGLISIRPLLAPRAALAGDAAAATAGPALGSFPRQDQELVRQVVGFSHAKLDELRPLVDARPALANATIDWGFGDWETAIGAASHVGRPDIAEFLMQHGARPDVFTFTMLGHLAVVRAMVEARPGLQRIRGPHGITLMQHAINGGDPAKEVAEYLASLGDADVKYKDEALADADKAALFGEYSFGPAEGDVLVVQEGMGGVTILRKGGAPRRLFHQGGLAFHPAGATEVRVEFERASDAVRRVRVTDAAIVVTAERIVS
jgi:hypothetical protein